MLIAIVLSPWLPLPLLALTAILLVLLAAAAAWRTRRSAPRWMVWIALLLRLLALACLCLLILRPETIRTEQVEKRRSILLLVDDTQSLLLRDTDTGPTRAEEGSGALQQLLEGAAARRWEVSGYDAGEKLETRHPTDAHLRGRAPSSPLGERMAEALALATQDPRSSTPCAGILFTDGCVNRGRSMSDAAAVWRDRGVPLFAVLLGRPRDPAPDAQLSGLIIRSGEAQASGAPIRGGSRLNIEAQGALLAGGPTRTGPLADATARLFISGPLTETGALFKEVGTLRHRLPESPAWTPVRLPFAPSLQGLYRVRLALDPIEGERHVENNIVYGSFEVIPPQRRILYIASRLGHNYRSLRDLLVNWDGPPVEVVTDFVTTRNEGEPAAAGMADGIVARWLGEGVPEAQRGGSILWEEPDFARIQPATQAKMRAAIQSGALSVAWILNENAAALRRRLHGSPLEDAFLFTHLEAPGTEPRPAGTECDPAARGHPVMQRIFSGRQGKDPLADLPTLTVCGEFAKPRDGTVVLLRSGTRPLLIVGRVGQGRVAILASGESWRWLAPLRPSGRDSAARGIAEQMYLGLVEWISDSSPRADPPVQLFLPKDEWSLGERLTARVVAHVNDPHQGLQVEHDLTCLGAGVPPPPRWKPWAGDVSAPEGAWDASLPTDTERGRLRAYSGTAGWLERSGEWLLRARVLLPDGRELGQDQIQFVVRGAPLEERSDHPDRDALRQAVEAAGVRNGQTGMLLEPRADEMSKLLTRLAPWMQPETISREIRSPAVSTGGLMGLLILALLVDIWLRRG
jgi:hypothetical protein